jgi:hypothetical protein
MAIARAAGRPTIASAYSALTSLGAPPHHQTGENSIHMNTDITYMRNMPVAKEIYSTTLFCFHHPDKGCRSSIGVMRNLKSSVHLTTPSTAAVLRYLILESEPHLQAKWIETVRHVRFSGP